MPTAEASLLLQTLQHRAQSMSGWLKFLGVFYILAGLPTLIVLVGVINIAMGVLLLQAGSAAGAARAEALLRLIDKLKWYFVINGVLTILALIVMGIMLALVLSGVMMGPFVDPGGLAV